MRFRIVVAVVATIASVVVVPDRAWAGVVTARGPGRLRWSQNETWGGGTPQTGDRVVIPSGTTVVLDASPPPLGDIEIYGKLVFAREDLDLRADNIMVHGDGALQVGSKQAPFTDRATITLTESDRTTDLMGMGGRLLGVMGGTLDLWGPQRVSWTQLGATASAGARSIELIEDVDWQPGDRIAIASTDYWPDHVDEATVASVEGRTVRLEDPLRYAHFGELQSFGGAVVDERAEVALLTRNIQIRGSDDSARDGYGAQMMIEEGGVAHLRGVELTRVGQKSRLRRYPVHFHMRGDASGSFIKGSSIHDSFNRCVTIHGTDRLVVARNVCYDHLGHGFFLEDGAENDNVLRGNLGFLTRAVEKDPLLPSDKRPATFWITNPDNTIVGNRAAGSDAFGFWYALPQHPTGLSSNETDVWPRRTPLKAFRGNVAHSNGSRGLNVDDGPRPNGTTESTYYDPHEDPADPDSPSVTARFEGFTAYKNRDRGVWLRGENHVVSNAVLADNRAGATFASSESFLDDSTVVAFTANKGAPEQWEDRAPDGRELPFFWEPEAPIHGFEFYDGRVGVTGTDFFGFMADSMRPAGALGYLEPDAFSIDPKNFARAVSFVDSTPVHLASPKPDMDGDLSKVFLDEDGSVTGTRGASVVVDNPFLLDDSCVPKPLWNSFVCNADYVSFMVSSLDNDPADIDPLSLIRPDGVAQRLHGCCDDSDEAWTTVTAGSTYAVSFSAPAAKGARFVIRDAPNGHVIVKLDQPPGFKVTRWGWPVDSVSSRNALDSADGSAWFYDEARRVLFVRVDGDGDRWNEIKVTN